MDQHSLGQLFALLAALTWAGALVLFKHSGERVPPLALNLFKNAVGLVLLSATLVFLREGLATLAGFSLADVCILAVSGVIGIALADTLLLFSLNQVGLGILSIVDCLYSPFVIVLSALLLSETLGWPVYVGGGLILFGVATSSRHPAPPGRTRAQLALGVLIGALAMGMIALGIVIAKPVLDAAGFPVFWATTIRACAGTIALGMMSLASPRRRAYWSVFRPSREWKALIPGSVLAMYLATVFWIAGFKYTHASVASILNQTTVVFALILATVVLKEPFTRRKLRAVVLACCGIALVTFREPAEQIVRYYWPG
ncbi:MAG: DMT family transporter [bacterium]|nr:DMT family transporter [bacterium]